MESLETARLIIRNCAPDDWQQLQEVAVAYEAFPGRFENPWPTSEEEVKGMASWFAEGDGYLAACLKDTGRLIGLVAIAHHEDAEGHEHGLGYVFHPDYHGKGYATEAMRSAMAYVFDDHGAERIRTGTHPDNAPSVKLLNRLGLRQIEPGTYTIAREEWLAAQSPSPR